jgi:hypothetical protein
LAVDDFTHSDGVQYTDSVSGTVTTDSAGDIIFAALTVSLYEFESFYDGSFIAEGSNFFSADPTTANSATANGLMWNFANPSGILDLSFNNPPALGTDSLSDIPACFTTFAGSSSFSFCGISGTDTISGSITDVTESVITTPVPATLPLFAGGTVRWLSGTFEAFKGWAPNTIFHGTFYRPLDTNIQGKGYGRTLMEDVLVR